jgi:group I intron endonuclease
MDMIGIYKIINPNNKVYIGQSVDILKRIQKYKWVSSIKKQPKIKRSIEKYGWENHEWEIITECSIYELDHKEYFYKQKFIEEFGWDKALFCQLYDTTVGGYLEKETKQKISMSKKGSKQSTETIERKRASLIKGKQCKPAYQYDLEGNFIKKWDYREDAEMYFNGKKGNNIGSCIKNKQNTAYGFQWKEKHYDKIEIFKPYTNKIIQFDLKNNFIKEWDSASTAEKEYNPESFIRKKYGSNNIRACIAGKQETAYGFIWKKS